LSFFAETEAARTDFETERLAAELTGAATAGATAIVAAAAAMKYLPRRMSNSLFARQPVPCHHRESKATRERILCECLPHCCGAATIQRRFSS
jgi:hypothetical protein